MRSFAPLRPWREVVRDLPGDRLVEVRGQRFHVSRDGAGPPLVLLHGIAASSYSYRDLIPLLAPGFETIAIDLSGFGKTERPRDIESYRIEEQADRIARLLDELGGDRVSIVGHSFGAAVAACLASRHPGRVEKLALVSPVTEFRKAPWFWRNWVGLRIAYGGVRLLLSDSDRFRRAIRNSFYREGILTRQVADHYRESMLVEGFREAFFGYAKALGGRGAHIPGYEKLAHSILVIAGEKDGIVTVDACERLVSSLHDGRLFVVPSCGHSAPEEAPEAVVSALGAFLGSPG